MSVNEVETSVTVSKGPAAADVTTTIRGLEVNWDIANNEKMAKCKGINWVQRSSIVTIGSLLPMTWMWAHYVKICRSL